jgi:hypothetical protein
MTNRRIFKGSVAAKTVKASFSPHPGGGRDHVGCIILGRGEDDREFVDTFEVQVRAA